MVLTFSNSLSLLDEGDGLEAWRRKGYPSLPKELLDTPLKRAVAALCVSMWDLDRSYLELVELLQKHKYEYSATLWLDDIAQVGPC